MFGPFLTSRFIKERLRARAQKKVIEKAKQTSGSSATPGKVATRWERQLTLHPYPPMGQFDEYLEMGASSSHVSFLAIGFFI
jgi:hypothetical protein